MSGYNHCPFPIKFRSLLALALGLDGEDEPGADQDRKGASLEAGIRFSFVRSVVPPDC